MLRSTRKSKPSTRIGGPIKAKLPKLPAEDVKKINRAGLFAMGGTAGGLNTSKEIARCSPYMFYQGEDLVYDVMRDEHSPPKNAKPAKKKKAPVDDSVNAGDVSSKAECDKIFKNIDTNGNGNLSLCELNRAVVELWPHYNNKAAIMRAYKIADASGNGGLDQTEFYGFLHFLSIFGKLAQKFKAVDTDGSGCLELPELMQNKTKLGFANESEKSLEKIFNEIDADGSGRIRFEELCVYMATRDGLDKHIPTRQTMAASLRALGDGDEDPRAGMKNGWVSPAFKQPLAKLSQLDDYDDEFTGGAVLTMVRELKSKRAKVRDRTFNHVFEQPMPDNLMLLQQRLQAEVRNSDGVEPLIKQFDFVALCTDIYGCESDFLIESLCKELDRGNTGFISYTKLMDLIVKYVATPGYKEATIEACFRVFDVDRRESLNVRRIRKMKAAKKRELYGTSGSNFHMIKAVLDLWNSSGDATLTTTLTRKSFSTFAEENGALIQGFLEEIFRQILVREFKYHRERLLAFPDPPTLLRCVNGDVDGYNKAVLSAIPEPAVFIPGSPFIPANTGVQL